MSSPLDVDVAIPPHAWALADVRFSGSPGDWLGDDARRMSGDWQAHFALGRLRRPVLVTIGQNQSTGPIAWRRCDWSPSLDGSDPQIITRPGLPSFTGRLGLQKTPLSVLLLRGSYKAHSGRVDNAIDGLVLDKVAEISAVQLLSELTERLMAPRWSRSRSSDAVRGDRAPITGQGSPS